MDKYYHFTSYYKLGSIMQFGLVPMQGLRWHTIGDGGNGVFVAKGIDKSIQMYASIRDFYLSRMGELGNELLAYYNKVVNTEPHSWKESCLKEECKIEIERIEELRKYKSFEEYLEGPGVLLSVDGLSGIDDSVPNNCFWPHKISPYSINIIGIRSKTMSWYTYDVEAIFAYYMQAFPKKKVLEGASKEEQGRIENFYNYVFSTNLRYYNPKDYEIFEQPLVVREYQMPKSLNQY